MRLIIKEDFDAMSDWAARYVKQRINQFNPTADKPFVLGLPTGSTPIGLYKRLAEYHAQGELSFKNVVTFNMDEYVGLDAQHAQSYHKFMYYQPSCSVREADWSAPGGTTSSNTLTSNLKMCISSTELLKGIAQTWTLTRRSRSWSASVLVTRK